MFHKHRFEIIGVRERVAGGMLALAGGGTVTDILKRCQCGAVESEAVMGSWVTELREFEKRQDVP